MYDTARLAGRELSPDDPPTVRLENGQRLTLTSTPQPFGGWRWWFVCPHCELRARKLYEPLWRIGRAACRRCYQLRYPSQSESKTDRWRRRAAKYFARAGLTGYEAYYYRPKGMHCRTFNRLVDAAESYENAAARLSLDALLARIRG